eukprot:1826406-Prymnesium_polylepis.1
MMPSLFARLTRSTAFWLVPSTVWSPSVKTIIICTADGRVSMASGLTRPTGRLVGSILPGGFAESDGCRTRCTFLLAARPY